MKTFTVAAPAKVNLRLRVLERDASGYHRIDTVFHALELADTLQVELAPTQAAGAAPPGAGDARHADRAPGPGSGGPPGQGIGLVVDGADVGPADENLVVRAARAFAEATGIAPAWRFRLRKRIAAGAGLGGGSSDAAATLRALSTLHDAPLDHDRLQELAVALGADVPFFLCGSPHARGTGYGHALTPLPALPRRPVLVLAPAFPVSTADAYRRLDELRGEGSAPGKTPDPAPAGGGGPDAGAEPAPTWDAVAAAAANDFEPVAFAVHPVLEEMKAALAAAGGRPALLAGSGSALFGVFEEEAEREAAASVAAKRWPDVALIPTWTAASVPR